MNVISMNAVKREKGTRGYVNKLRNRGLLPAVLYGKNSPDMLLAVDVSELKDLMKKGDAQNAIIDLKVEGEKQKFTVILRELQREPIGQVLSHADFQAISMNEPIRTQVPIHLNGTPVGVKAGGVLQHGLREIEVEALPTLIPARLEVDASELEIGSSLFVKDLSITEGAVILSDPDSVILTIITPRAVEEAAKATDEGLPTEDSGKTDDNKTAGEEGDA